MAETIEPMALDDAEEKQPAPQMVAQARESGVGLVGPGLLAGLTTQVLALGLEEELTERLGYEAGDLRQPLRPVRIKAGCGRALVYRHQPV